MELCEPCVTVVSPWPKRTFCLSNADLTTLATEDTEHIWGIQSQIVLHSIKQCVRHCRWQFLGALAKLRKATTGFVMSACPLGGSQWMDLHEKLYLSIFRKSVEKIQVSLKSDNNTRRPIYLYDQISINSS